MLTKKDFSLIYELDSNYKETHSRIGKKIRISEQLVNYKVNSFIKRSIIQSNCPLIDYSRFGYLTFMVYFKVNYLNRESFDKLIERMKLNSDIIRIMECDGTYDLITIFAAKNPSSFNKMLKQLIAENLRELKDRMILTTVVEHHSLRNYLIDKEPLEDTIIGGDREETLIDAVNKKILHSFLLGKKRVIDIAQEASVTTKTVISRIKWLENKEIIKGYRLLLNLRDLGIHSNIILIKYHNVSVKEEENFRYFCKSNPNIIEYIKTFGEWDVVLNIETRDLSDFRKLYLNIREKFEDIIENYDNFRVFQVHKEQFLPLKALEYSKATSSKNKLPARLPPEK